MPYLDLKLPDTRSQIWNKLRIALKWAHDNEIDNFDYVLRADDDSYYVMENLRFMLLSYNPNKALYFGARFKYNSTTYGYMSGGAGIILSKEALKQIIASLENPLMCPPASTTEYHDDKQLGICAKNLNITFVDTRDSKGRHRMLPWSPGTHFTTLLEPRHFEYLYYSYRQDSEFECCAEHMISFHYVYKDTIHLLEFLFYHAKTIGNSDSMWQKIQQNVELKDFSLTQKLNLASIDNNSK